MPIPPTQSPRAGRTTWRASVLVSLGAIKMDLLIFIGTAAILAIAAVVGWSMLAPAGL
jgi:hypothetical protein